MELTTYDKVISSAYAYYSSEPMKLLLHQAIGEYGDVDQFFMDFYLFNFKVQDKTLIDTYLDENELIMDELKNTQLGFFTVHKGDGKEILTDMSLPFNKTIEDGFYFGRIMEVDRKMVFCYEPESIDEVLMPAIRQSIYYQYNQQPFNVSLEEFLKNHAKILYKYFDEMKKLEEEAYFEDEDLKVYQSSYIFQMSRTDFMKVLMGIEGMNLIEFEDSIFQFFHDDSLAAEIVVEDKRFEIECRTGEERTFIKTMIEHRFKEQIKHVEDKELSIEDLL